MPQPNIRSVAEGTLGQVRARAADSFRRDGDAAPSSVPEATVSSLCNARVNSRNAQGSGLKPDASGTSSWRDRPPQRYVAVDATPPEAPPSSDPSARDERRENHRSFHESPEETDVLHAEALTTPRRFIARWRLPTAISERELWHAHGLEYGVATHDALPRRGEEQRP